MRWLKRAVLTIVLLVAAAAAVGLMLPERFRVERSIEIAAPAAKVYALIADPRAWKRWSVWNQRDPDMAIEYGGPVTGKGASWTWKSRTEGNGSMVFSDAVQDRRIVYRLSFPEMGMESAGSLELQPAGAGVRLSWSNEGALGMNPINRWFGYFMDRMVGPDFEAGLVSLKRLAETQ